MIIVLYLFAIVLANTLSATYGPTASVFNAFVLIGFDLSARDALHYRWRNQHLKRKMLCLVLTGSILSFVLNRDTAQIAIASAVAFSLSALADTVAYQALWYRNLMVKINGSNAVGAALDSLVFPTLAFGAVMPHIIAAQFTAKVLGGFVWSVVLHVVFAPKSKH